AFRHDSIPEGIAAVEKIALEKGWRVTATEDAAKISSATLVDVTAVMFLSTTGNILDAEQETALQNYLESGGGFIGVHAASDTEHDWQWYHDYRVDLQRRRHGRRSPDRLVT